MTALHDELLEEYHHALEAITRGNPDIYKSLCSRGDDVTLANPFGPVAVGRAAVEDRLERAAAIYEDGEIVGFERLAKYETPELAYLVEVESYRAKVGGSHEHAPVSLRVTSIFRPEGGGWKVVHRHADPITSERPPESVVER